MRHSLDVKSAQLEAAKARLVELESQLLRRDSMFTDQKRLLKTVKEEYRDRIRALEEKYTAQKAVILRLEEEMLELYNKQPPLGGAAAIVSPTESERTGNLIHFFFFIIMLVTLKTRLRYCRFDGCAHISTVNIVSIKRWSFVEPSICTGDS